MDQPTVRIYEDQASAWAAKRVPRRRADVSGLADHITPGAPRADLGCGPGFYTSDLGEPTVALDAAFNMLRLAHAAAPGAWCVQADLELLPFRPRSLGGAWARNSYLHLPAQRLPLALAELHRATVVDAPIFLRFIPGDYEGHALPGDDFPGRFFVFWDPDPLRAVVEGAGFTVDHCETSDGAIEVHGRRARTLPDFVGPGMRILMCGLNPSLRSADVGFGFAGPSNRFWTAAIDAGLVTRPRDPWDALSRHGMGMTDLVKRATVGAAELRAGEYREGRGRVERLVQWLRPGVICFVGLAGYRAAVDKRAQPGAQPEQFGGVPTYVMPSTSGLNARVSRADLTDHLRGALALAPRTHISRG
ncbi:MAG: uracil-DNA glycosylase family protein [Acidimicrobiia bacterium]